MPTAVQSIDLPDLWAFLRAKKVPLAAVGYRALLAEVAAGRVVGISDGERLVAIGGLADAGGGRRVAWCSVADGGVGRHAVAAVRVVRRVVSSAGGGPVIAVVAENNASGNRLARAVGLTDTGARVEGMGIWAWTC